MSPLYFLPFAWLTPFFQKWKCLWEKKKDSQTAHLTSVLWRIQRGSPPIQSPRESYGIGKPEEQKGSWAGCWVIDDGSELRVLEAPTGHGTGTIRQVVEGGPRQKIKCQQSSDVMAVKLTAAAARYLHVKSYVFMNLNAVIKRLQTDALYKSVKHKDDYSLLKIWESRKDFQQRCLLFCLSTWDITLQPMPP